MPKPCVNERSVAVLAFDPIHLLEFSIATEFFGLPRPEVVEGWYDFATVGEGLTPVPGTGGVLITPSAGLDAISKAGTIIVPGWRIAGPPPSAALREALLNAFERGARFVSICSGAFLLAELGMLKGKRAATHWLYVDAFREKFPDIDLDPDVLYIDEGQVLTSAGSAAGIDLLLYVVRQDFGPAVANKVARRLVVPPHREGGQLQFVDRPVPVPREAKMALLLDEIRRDPSGEWTVNEMASRCAMSVRTFARRFSAMTGKSPGDWIMHERLHLAKELLETTDRNLAEIASASGLGLPENMSRRFRERVGVSPGAYRRTFQQVSRMTGGKAELQFD
jgi:AraC family transcriptional activator FtrA